MLHLIRLFSFVVLSRVCHAQCTLTPYVRTVFTWLWRWLPHRLIVKTSITVNNSPIQELLGSPGWSYSTYRYLWNYSWVQTFHSVCVLFISQENHIGCLFGLWANCCWNNITFDKDNSLYCTCFFNPMYMKLKHLMFWFHLTTLYDCLKKHHVIIVKLFIFFSEAVLWQ